MKSVIFHILPEEKAYLGRLKSILSGRCQTFIDTTRPTTATEFCIKAKQRNADAVISTSEELLRLCLPQVKNPRISEYAGSFFKFRDTWFLFVSPLEQLVTVAYGEFVMRRFVDKVLHPELWIVEPPFKWEQFEPSKLEEIVSFLDSCTLVAVDIETLRNDPERRMVCVGFCGIKLSGGQLTIRTIVVPVTDMYNLLVVRLLCSGPALKVFQNGKYDIAYLYRFGCPPFGYTFDTINLFHSWLSELPKDLGFISAFMVHTYVFHKNDGKTGDLYDLYEYNARDVYVTALSAIALILEIPDYARQNYLQEFPLVFPCILSEHTGLKWNEKKAGELRARVEADMEKELARLRVMVANKNYNPNSPQQTQRLFAILGSKDITTTDKIGRDKVSSRHPLNQHILKRIEDYREGSKLRGSYFKDSIPWKGRCFYALNPHGTDTGRLASRESQFWCGLQIQNIPRDGDEGDVTVKEAFDADPDFYFGEADYEQAETRDTAHITGDKRLLEKVSDPSIDFHGSNASDFFGIPYEKIVKSTFDEEFQEWVHKTLDKPLRDLSKRTNHGANYNMGENVMVDTMGLARVIKAKQLLGLPSAWKPAKVTAYLLERFAQTYPVVRHDYQEWIKTTVSTSGLLVGATGWTRRCFGSPKSNKRHLNSYVAHCPQSLNAMMLNQAYLKVFYEVYLPNSKDFKLCAQIHDSILFQYRKGYEHLAWAVADCMVIPTPVTDIFGISRVLRVPVALKGNGTTWSNVETLRRHKEKVAA